MPKKFRHVRRILPDHGFVHERTRGSHELWIHPDGRRVTLPGGGKSNREDARGTLDQLRKATGIEELR